MDINAYLQGMLTEKASDLYITVGAPILYRVDGELKPVSYTHLRAHET